MTRKDYEMFRDITQMSQDILKKNLRNTLSAFYEEKNIYCRDGYLMFLNPECKIMLIAHLDTVHKFLPVEIFKDSEEGVIWSPEGIGGDDRCGVYAILKIVGAGYRPNICFVEDEEVGAKGASKLINDFSKPPVDLNYLIELDRRGEDDCVFYDCENPEFTEYVEKFGFHTAYGTFSDISIIAPMWGLAAVNLSIGYDDEHTNIERVYISFMELTIDRVKAMLDESDASKKFIYIKSVIPAYSKYYSSMYNYYDYSDYLGPGELFCEECGKVIDTDEAIPILEDKETAHICPTCYIEKILPDNKSKGKGKMRKKYS